MSRISTVLLALASSLVGPASTAVENRRPNVVLMMADDLATDDLSCYGSERIRTPRLDELAEQGLRLTGYYAGSPVCTPSRMALLSGAYPARLGWRRGVLGYGFERGTGMSEDVYTIAEAFRDAGYRTAMSGKWHLGTRNLGPDHQGFESSFGIHMSNNQNRDVYRDGELVEKDRDNRLLTETFAEEAIRLIDEESDEPFFLYVPWSAPHFPAEPHPEWYGRSGEDRSARYVDVVEELDHRLGQVLDALEAAGRADDTIVVFTSDNGRQSGQEGADSDPQHRGRKWQSLEGGTRVPCIVRYPGHVPAGATSDAIVAAIDLYPTLAAACGVEIDLPGDAQELDGMDLWPLLVDPRSADAARRDELLYWHGRGQATAIRIGDWKLYFHAGESGDPDVSDGPVLYHLRVDPTESNDLAGRHPDRVARMLERAARRLTDVYGNQVPIGTWEGVAPGDPPLETADVWGEWLD